MNFEKQVDIKDDVMEVNYCATKKYIDLCIGG